MFEGKLDRDYGHVTVIKLAFGRRVTSREVNGWSGDYAWRGGPP